MGQTEVAAVFEAEPDKEFTVKEVASIVGVKEVNARRCMNKLSWMLDIKIKQHDLGWRVMTARLKT